MSIAKKQKWVSPWMMMMKALLSFIFLITLSTLGYSQTKIQVKGKVVDDAGKPIPGASVLVKGTATGATCTEAGVFNLAVTADKKLVVSAIGYETKEIAIPSEVKNFTIKLAQVSAELEKVVVIGYGTARKRDLTGSVASISGEVTNAVPAVDISNALQGRIAGCLLYTSDAADE